MVCRYFHHTANNLQHQNQLGTLPLNMRNLYEEGTKDITQEELSEICVNKFSTITVSEEEAKYAEILTRTQSSSKNWHMLRVGRITASKAHSVLHTEMNNPAKSLIKGLNQQPRGYCNKYAQWGINHEEDALKVYGSIFGAETAPVPQKLHLAGVDLVTHTEPILHKSGIHTDCAIPYVATSPDGIFICKCYDPLVVEVKCLHRLKEMTINDYIATQKDTCLFPDHTPKETHAYYHQV